MVAFFYQDFVYNPNIFGFNFYFSLGTILPVAITFIIKILHEWFSEKVSISWELDLIR